MGKVQQKQMFFGGNPTSIIYEAIDSVRGTASGKLAGRRPPSGLAAAM